MGPLRSIRTVVRDLRSRSGAIMIMAVFFMIVILAFVALSVDIGFIAVTRGQMQAAADGAALAAAMELTCSDDPAVVRQKAIEAAKEVASKYENGDRASVVLTGNGDIEFGQQVALGGGKYQLKWGHGMTPYNVVKVKVGRGITQDAHGKSTDNSLPLFFAPALGSKSANLSVEAIASFQPRDIMVVLDFSGSMNDDSCLGAISKLGRAAVEDNLLLMWNELGSPEYGELDFKPVYATLDGAPATKTTAFNQVTFRRTAVDIVSTGKVTGVTLTFSNGKSQAFSGLTGTGGTFLGTGSYAKQEISSVAITSTVSVTSTTTTTTGKGKKKKTSTTTTTSQVAGTEVFTFTPDDIVAALGLTMAYPYPKGSWDEYVKYVQEKGNAIDSAGYRDMYGYLNWMHYLQYYHPYYSDTPDLWKTSEQPVTALKDGVDLFIEELGATGSSDYAGLSIYSYPTGAGAILEHPLSSNVTQIKTTTRKRQAGHYTGGTNIGAGMQVARLELEKNARPRSVKWMIVMTDGQANLPGNSTAARQLVLQEVKFAQKAGIKVMTITVGVDADVALMKEVADSTGGEFFQVPGDQPIAKVKEQLLATFRKIANSRPLKLIK